MSGYTRDECALNKIGHSFNYGACGTDNTMELFNFAGSLMKKLINYLIGSHTPKSNPSGSREDTGVMDRRKFPRLEIPEGVPIETEFITQDEILWETRCLDVSSEGAQIEFSEYSYPKVEDGEKAILKLRLAGQEVNLPAIVMTRQKHRMSLFLPLDVIAQNQEQEEIFFRILLTLERAILRRKVP